MTTFRWTNLWEKEITMTNYKMVITLLSDLCVSDGGVYNSFLDQDVCHDRYGFPYIPAKRIRGCLRECALELQDWRAEISPEKLFGKEGREKSPIRIGDALLKDYKGYVKIAQKYAGNPIFHEQNILKNFTYIRSQTAIDYDTGVAEEGSLRNMRVINKGNVFYSDVEVRDDALIKPFQDCCKVFTHLGVDRTRGLGEIHVELEPIEVESSTPVSISSDAEQLTYTIELLEPIICKSVNGEESNSLDYIDGGKVLGIIANSLDNGDFLKFINKDKLFISNAYLSKYNERFLELPSCFCTVKNNPEEYRNKIFENNDKKTKEDRAEQLSMVRDTYALRDSEDAWKIKAIGSVEIEQRYHHRRAEDKSIGRADPEDDNAAFYQMSSICAGQTFMGYITGSPEQLKIVADALTANPIQYMGYSRMSEYGKVKIYVQEDHKKITKLSSVKSFAVVLESPTIVYNENAFYSTDPKDLIEEIEKTLECVLPKDSVKKFIHYTTIGGFNVTWGERKPIITAFDKGTTIAFKLNDPIDINIDSSVTLGERQSEGFGEFTVFPIHDDENEYKQSVKALPKETDHPEVSYEEQFVKPLCKDILKRYLNEKAMEAAKKISKPENRSTVSNLTLMCKEQSAQEGYFGIILEIAKHRFDDKNTENKKRKNNVANQILNEKNGVAFESFKRAIQAFSQDYNVQNLKEEPWMEKEYLIDFLTNAKYEIRRGE